MVIEGVQFRDLGAMLGTLAAALFVGVSLVYRAYNRWKIENQTTTTETATLKMLDAAVEHWKGLYETAWAQVSKERELREKAEQRVAALNESVEGLRAEVSTLKSEVARLSKLVQQQSEG